MKEHNYYINSLRKSIRELSAQANSRYRVEVDIRLQQNVDILNKLMSCCLILEEASTKLGALLLEKSKGSTKLDSNYGCNGGYSGLGEEIILNNPINCS